MTVSVVGGTVDRDLVCSEFSFPGVAGRKMLNGFFRSDFRPKCAFRNGSGSSRMPCLLGTGTVVLLFLDTGTFVVSSCLEDKRKQGSVVIVCFSVDSKGLM